MQKEMKSESMMRDAPVRQLFLKMSIPAIVITLVIVAYNLADVFFIGQTGDAAQVAAISLAGPIFSILSGIGTLLGAGGSTAVAIALGKDEKKKIKSITSFCFYGALTIGILFAVIVLLMGDSIPRILGADEFSSGYTADYVRILSIGAPFILFSNVFANIVRADGSAKESMIANMIGTFVNIALDPLMIITLNMGVTGAALATVIGNACSCLYLVRHVSKKQPMYSFCAKYLSLKKDVSLHVLSLGLPMAISTMLGSFSSIFSNNLMSQYGNIAVAANGVASKVGMLIVMVAMGICMGIQPAVSYNYGAKNYKRVYRILKSTAGLTIVVGSVLTLVCYLLRNQIVGAFINDASVIEYGQRMVIASLVVGPLYGLYQTCTTFLQGTGKVSYAILLASLRQGLLLVPVLYVANSMGGLQGLIFASPITEVLALAVGIVLCVKWKRSMDRSASDEESTSNLIKTNTVANHT